MQDENLNAYDVISEPQLGCI